jgi:phosphatidylglycerol:prolipoprotein diacylglycerol transferase
LHLGDLIASVAAPGLMLGRIANFITGELWGKVTDVPWAVIFQGSAGSGMPLELIPPRHPSQLYEAALEGLLLFLILWIFSARARPLMAVSGMFLFFYGLFRFAVEFVRTPDEHIGYLAFDWLTMGQLLSAPMIIIGLGMFMLAYKRNRFSSSISNSNSKTASEGR